jgi:hypothetical protein
MEKKHNPNLLHSDFTRSFWWGEGSYGEKYFFQALFVLIQFGGSKLGPYSSSTASLPLSYITTIVLDI